MAKAIIFDLDGVLVDSKEIHFNSLNLALSNVGREFVISKSEQDNIFEGLTTKSKLTILSQLKNLDASLHGQIWKDKQAFSTAMFSSVSRDTELISLFNYIKSHDILIGVASNSIRSTLDGCLAALGLDRIIDYSLSNEDVSAPKPNPEIYIKCMNYFGAASSDVVIFEDSPIGKAAAIASGATVVEVINRADLTLEKIAKSVMQLTVGSQDV